jgi:hypothetical protein
MYKIDVSEVEELVALAEVTGEEEESKSLRFACATFGIVLDEAKVADKALQFAEVARKLATKANKAKK